MVLMSLFNGNASDSLESLRHSELSKKLTTAKCFVKPERLPPTTVKFHCRRTYLQGMQWMSKSDGMMNSTEWGWEVQPGMCKLAPLMMDKNPALDKLLKMIHCNCSTRCVTKKCSCRSNGLECTTTCVHVWENMDNEGVIKDEELDKYSKICVSTSLLSAYTCSIHVSDKIKN